MALRTWARQPGQSRQQNRSASLDGVRFTHPTHRPSTEALPRKLIITQAQLLPLAMPMFVSEHIACHICVLVQDDLKTAIFDTVSIFFAEAD